VDVPDRFVSDRNLIQVGQRFYFVEIAGATPRPLARFRTGGDTADTSSTRVVLDFPRGQLRVFVHYAEPDAQRLKVALQKKSPAVIPALLTAGLDASLRAIFGGSAPKHLRVVHEAVPTQQFLAGAAEKVIAYVGGKVVDWIVDWAMKALQAELERGYQQMVEKFRKAAEDPASGVTLIFVFNGPTFFEGLRKMLTAPGGLLPPVAALLQLRAAVTASTVELKPGPHYW
jgi:hypothetical protein